MSVTLVRDDLSPAAAAASSLEELLTRVAVGENAAFEDFYYQTSSRVFGMIVRILLSHAQAEEVCQEVYLDLWRRADRFDPERGTAMAFVFTLAHRKAVDRVRSSQATIERDHRIGVRDWDHAYDSVAETIEVRIEHERVTKAMAALSHQHREAIELACYRGLTHTEIAAALDLPMGTIKSRLRDGMIRLRDLLGVSP